jgi:rare lipoprotein A
MVRQRLSEKPGRSLGRYIGQTGVLWSLAVCLPLCGGDGCAPATSTNTRSSEPKTQKAPGADARRLEARRPEARRSDDAQRRSRERSERKPAQRSHPQRRQRRARKTSRHTNHGAGRATSSRRSPSRRSRRSKKRFVQHGKASWYGRRHHGGPTASGERYDMHAMTAAHKKLPFGTMVRVTRKDTNRTVTVRINDRGPYSRGRIIDLSRKAASRLKMLRAGVVRVKIEVVRWGSGRRSHRKGRTRGRKPGSGPSPERRYRQGSFGKKGPPLPR